MKRRVFFILLCLVFIGLFGCSEADIASQNLSREAEKFNIYRRVVFYNGITDEYILMVEGYCSVEFYPDKFVVTVKLEDGSFIKHYLGRADNVFPFVEQIEPAKVSDDRYHVVFKPKAIIPVVEVR